MITNSNNQILLNEINYLNNQQDPIIYLECVQTQALMDSDDADSNSMIDLIGDIEMLVNVVGGTYDLAKFASAVMRVPTEIGTETIDMALNPSITAATRTLGWKAVGETYNGQIVHPLMQRLQSYWSFQAQKAIANKMGYSSASQLNKATGQTAIKWLSKMTGYKSTGNSYRTAMKLKNAYNIIKFGKTGANLIKGIPYLGTAIDVGMIGATWKHSDAIAKSGGITGAAMGIGGIIAAPFTFGGSLALSIGGAALGAGTSFM